MVAPNKELANKFSFSSSNIQVSQIISCSTNQMDIDMEKPRCHSILFSPNTSREPSAHSDVLSMDYADQVQALANNQTWVEQVESRTIQTPYLFYTTVMEVEDSSSNKVSSVENTYIPHVADTTNMYTP